MISIEILENQVYFLISNVDSMIPYGLSKFIYIELAILVYVKHLRILILLTLNALYIEINPLAPLVANLFLILWMMSSTYLTRFAPWAIDYYD